MKGTGLTGYQSADNQKRAFQNVTDGWVTDPSRSWPATPDPHCRRSTFTATYALATGRLRLSRRQRRGPVHVPCFGQHLLDRHYFLRGQHLAGRAQHVRLRRHQRIYSRDDV